MLSAIFRWLPAFKGKHRLARLLLSSALAKKRDIIVTGTYNINYKLPNLKESIGFDIFVDGIYEPRYIHFLARKVPQNGIFLDLGANIGSICIALSKLRTDIKIVAVEASQRVFSYLKHNIELNGCKNIIIENFALSISDNEQVGFYSPEEKFGKGSMSPVFTREPEMVTTITLDTLVEKHELPRVDFIKIDVEGYESIVFQSGKKLLSQHGSPPVLFEFAHWAENLAKEVKAGDAQRTLLSFGYKLYNANNPQSPVVLNEVLTEGTFMLLAQKDV